MSSGPDRFLPGLSAAILAGGSSRRFGSDKALAAAAGRPLLAHPARLLGQLVDDLFVLARDSSDYGFLGLRVKTDLRPGLGPLSGVHAALSHARHPRVLVTACDMPCPDERLLRHLATVRAGPQVVVPCSPRGIEPLLAIYDRACLPAVEEALDAGRLSLARLVERLPHERIPWSTVSELVDGRDPFVNVNTRDDLERLTRTLGHREADLDED